MTGMADKVAALAKAHSAAWTAGDLEETLALFASDAESSVNGADPHRGHDAIRQGAAALMADFSGLTVTCNETRSAGSRAVFLWTLTGTHKESGRDATLPGWHEWELNGDDTVQRCRGFYDAADLRKQIGAD